jgi:hypothetical protein
MNEQPFADPTNPPTPDLVSRQKLTQQIEKLQATTARCIAENNPKGAVMALQQTQVLLMALMVDELQSTQQMFERLDHKLDGVLTLRPQSTLPAPPPAELHAEHEGQIPKVAMTEEQYGAFRKTIATLAAVVETDAGGLLAAGTQLLIDAMNEYNANFVVAPNGS